MTDKNLKTLRLLMPQWQGGNNGVPYPLGARLLAWLAPESAAPLLEVPVTPYAGQQVVRENGIVEQTALIEQTEAARKILEEHRPDRVIVFGGDCLVSQAPFAYLNERYNGELGVLWIDAHPDVTTPQQFEHEHAMVLGNLLGEGDPAFAGLVKTRIKPELVMFAGVDDTLPHETEIINRLNLRRASTAELAVHSGPVLDWIREKNIRHLAIHLDLDVLDPQLFRSQLFNNPNDPTPINAFSGKMSFPIVTRLIKDVEQETAVVGMSYAEHMPWDDINLKGMMEQFSFMK